MKRIDAICAVLTVILCIISAAHYAETAQAGVSSAVARLHVLANSDTPEDQAMKLAVRDGILEELYPELSVINDKGSALALLSSRLGRIEALAESIVTGLGADYPVKAYIVRDYFPTRQYGSASLPAGMYDALRVEIGEAAGQNWWCVMFPPLCFVDIAAGYYDSEGAAELKNMMTAEGASLVSETPGITVRFKVVEIWQGIKNFFGRNK